MRSGYGKFKNKIRRGVALKCFLFALSIGLVSISTVLLLGKLNIIEDNPMLAAVIGGVAFVLSLTVALVVAMPKAQRTAELIDGELNMRERVQTMHAFRGVKGRIIELQRKDTEARLKKMPLDWYSVKRVWVYLLVLILSVALCSFAYIVPDMAEKPGEVPQDEPFELSEWQELALENLIEYVQTSELCDTAKISIAEELNTLLSNLKITDTVRRMKTLVIATIVEVNSIIDDTNSYDEFSAALKRGSADGMAELSAAIGTPDKPATDEVYGALELTHPEGIEPPFTTTASSSEHHLAYGKDFFYEDTKYNPHSPYSAAKASTLFAPYSGISRISSKPPTAVLSTQTFSPVRLCHCQASALPSPMLPVPSAVKALILFALFCAA